MEHGIGLELLRKQRDETARIREGLLLAIREQVCRFVIGQLVRQVRGEVFLTFGDEEGLMLRLGYPGYTRHRAEHREFAEEVRRMELRALEAEGAGPCAFYELSAETNRLLADWQTRHIEGADGRLAEFLTSISKLTAGCK
jgi:hemerythrin